MSLRPLTVSLGLAIATAAQASGFSLIESNADGQGSACAGSAAVAENASTLFFNPAGMTRLPGRQLVASLHAIDVSVRFDDGNPATADGGDAGGLSLVPNLYYAMPITASLWFGLGINVPFGLKTEYDPNWVGKVQGIKSEMKTVNINPAVAWRLNDKLSLGLGLNAMYIEAELTSFVPAPAGTLTIRGDDWGYGYNAGLLYEVDGTPGWAFPTVPG
jgi:long-chain fatty acid transport protein